MRPVILMILDRRGKLRTPTFLQLNKQKIIIIIKHIFIFRTLNFNKQPLLIGGLASADPILERPDQIHSDDFVGCVHSVMVNGRPLNLSQPLSVRGVLSTCGRHPNGGPCSQGLPADPTLSLCGSFGQCTDRWQSASCKCGGHLLSPDCYSSLDSISLGDGGFVEFKMSEKHRRMQLLETFYAGSTAWTSSDVSLQRPKRMESTNVSAPLAALSIDPPKMLSLLFRTVRSDGLILYAATNKHYTAVSLANGHLIYRSQQSAAAVNMTVHSSTVNVVDGKWHNVTLYSFNRVLHLELDGHLVGDEFDAAGVHDFLDPYLTVLSVGGVRRELLTDLQPTVVISNFEGCLANFTINNEIQPFNGSGSVFRDVLTRGKVYQGCHGVVGVGAAQLPDPLSIGITLVIVFFVILLVAILISFVVFRLRKQHKEKSGGPGGGNGGLHATKQNGSQGLVLATSGSDGHLGSRGLHHTNDSFHSEGDIIRGMGHHMVVGPPEILSKKFKERDLGGGVGSNVNDHQMQQQIRPQRPDIIEREVVSKSPPPMPPQSSNQHHSHGSDHPGGVDMNEYPEHYDLENASSIAPSDIDIVYHYKGYREASGGGGGGPRKYKATLPPAVASYTHHKHGPSSVAQQQHRHSPHHGSFAPRPPPLSQQQQSSQQTSSSVTSNGPSSSRQHQSTPLARLSPSSELSSQQPRILTLHDISGKPLQSALLATTSSSGGVGKDALHSNSERSLNSPVMSQLSGQSSSASRTKPGGVPPQGSNVNSAVGSMGLTAEEIQRLNARPRTSSLVSTLDAVSSSSEAPRAVGGGGGGGGVGGGTGPQSSGTVGIHHLTHMHHSPSAVDAHSSTTTDESGNDSFTCSEIEYDNNSLNGDKFPTTTAVKNRHQPDRSRGVGQSSGSVVVNGGGVDPNGVGGVGVASASSTKPPMLPPPYDGFDSSFRGSLSTLVASDDDLSTHISGMYHRPQNATSSPSPATTLGWDYLLNWGPNFESLMGVFKDIAELPDNVNGGAMVPSLRMPANVQKPSEEYV